MFSPVSLSLSLYIFYIFPFFSSYIPLLLIFNHGDCIVLSFPLPTPYSTLSLSFFFHFPIVSVSVGFPFFSPTLPILPRHFHTALVHDVKWPSIFQGIQLILPHLASVICKNKAKRALPV